MKNWFLLSCLCFNLSIISMSNDNQSEDFSKKDFINTFQKTAVIASLISSIHFDNATNSVMNRYPKLVVDPKLIETSLLVPSIAFVGFLSCFLNDNNSITLSVGVPCAVASSFIAHKRRDFLHQAVKQRIENSKDLKIQHLRYKFSPDQEPDFAYVHNELKEKIKKKK